MIRTMKEIISDTVYVTDFILKLLAPELDRAKALDDDMYRKGRIEGLQSAIQIINGYQEGLSRTESPEGKDAAALAQEALNG